MDVFWPGVWRLTTDAIYTPQNLHKSATTAGPILLSLLVLNVYGLTDYY